MTRRAALLMACLLLGAGTATAQQPLDLAHVTEALDRDGHVALTQSHVLVAKADYVAAGDTVEAIVFRPAADGRYPAVLLIPGYSRTARDYIPTGVRFAREGF